MDQSIRAKKKKVKKSRTTPRLKNWAKPGLKYGKILGQTEATLPEKTGPN